MNGIMDAGLADRDGACNLARIPTGRYPLYSETLKATFDASGNAIIDFEAERDLLITELTIIPPPTGCGVVSVDAEYCNTRYLEHSSVRNWSVCCDRRPFFLVGIRENKSLELRFTGGADGDEISATIMGFQGSGCCG